MSPDVPVPALPGRPRTAHKRTSGRVAVMAGSPGMSGAAVLCGRGALRTGAGLVRILSDARVVPAIAPQDPCLMVEEITSAALCEWPDVVIAGPGWGNATGATSWLARAIGTDVPCVLDADGINLLGDAPGGAPLVDAVRDRRCDTILTPHPGEMRRLIEWVGGDDVGDDNHSRSAAATHLARTLGAVIVLKGHRTVIADGERVVINTTGNPGMATGGMGDVLAGVIGALRAQRMEPFDAAVLGAHVHGAAGDLCRDRIGPVGFTATDVIEQLPRALAGRTAPSSDDG